MQQEIERLEYNLTGSLNIQSEYKKECEELRTRNTHLEDKVKMQEEFYKMDKTEILELEAQLALAKLRLHRVTERANMLQKTIDGISFSM